MLWTDYKGGSGQAQYGTVCHMRPETRTIVNYGGSKRTLHEISHILGLVDEKNENDACRANDS